MSGSSSDPAVTFVWDQFAPYHHDRCEAIAGLFAGRHVVGIEIANRSDTYAWDSAAAGNLFERVTLAPGRALQEIPWRERLSLLLAQLRRTAPGPVFLCNYERPEIFLTALWLRLCGRPVFVMVDSKFDDRSRHLWREIAKWLLYLPYKGAMASGARTRDYLRLLGFSAARIQLGYDTLSVARVRRLAAAPPAPGGAPFAQRQFVVVARFVPKKNLPLAIAAYDLYRQAAGSDARGLVFVGGGPLEADLRADVTRRGLEGVTFAGFLQEEGVAQALANGLALILPSIEEQWGLVVNEAVAMGLPVLCTGNVGACDDLVRAGRNGYVIEPDNAEGLARLMERLATDESEWCRLCEGSLALAPRADVARFADAVRQLLGMGSAPSR